MKKIVIASVSLLLFVSMIVQAPADTKNAAVASVYVQVVPNVSVATVTPLLDLGTVQTGFFSAVLTWKVDANMESVKFFLEASNLYKGDDPLNSTVAPIPVAVNQPAKINAQFGNEINSGDNMALWGAAGDPIGAYPTVATETVTYESSQNGHFSQNVITTIAYFQPDPEQPTGQYSGKVRLTVLL